jgi:hypothetical protein
MQHSAQSNDLGNLVSQVIRLEKYREERKHLFPTEGSMDWCVRRHKARLVSGGALLLMRGTWHVNPVAFDAVLVEIMQEEARALVGNGSGPVIA